MALQSSLNQHHESLSQSWGSIWDITHQINKTDLGPCIEQWRNHNCKQHLIQKRIQEVLQSIIKNLSSSNINAKGMMSSMDAVLHSLGSIKEKLNMQPVRKNISHWLDNIHILVCDAIAKIEAVSQTFTIFKKEQGSFNCEVQKQVKCLDSLQEELDQLLAVQERAYDKLLKLDKAQSMKTDTLLATVLHHEEAWDQFNRTLKDMNKELHSLSRNSQCAKQSNEKRSRSPVEQRTLHVKSLVTKISADIRESISDIEHRQSQATHLEVDLSSIGLVLESAQKEMVDITKDRSSKDISELVICLINKLNKELNNALTKTVSLVEIYKNAKKNYIKSSKRILQIQREFDSLEEELHNFHYYICQDSDQPKSPHRDTRTCPIQAELDNYKNRCPEKKDKLQCNNKSLKENCTKMQTSPVKRDAAMKVVNVLELKSNIKDFYQLACNQDETICLLQNSLKICQKEGDELRKKIKCLESKKEEAENGCEKRIKCYQEKICELQNALKKSEDVTVWKDSESLRILQNANLELATIAGQVQEDYRCLQLRFSDIHNRMVESEKKHQRSEAALQIVIANLKERMGKEQKRLCDVLKERKQLQEELRNATTGSKLELENIKEREASSNQENQSYIDELKKQAKCWSVRMADIEAELMNVKEKFCEELHNKEDLQHQLSEKEADFKKEICEKYKEINKLTTAVNSLNDKLKEKEAELVCERAKQCETEQKLMSLCSAYDQLKIKAKEKEETAGKLHAALTQLSNKFVSRRLDNKDCIRHYQEECAKFEALYNTTACKLHSKELELCTLIQENERLKNELQEISICPPQEKEEESCPFLLERVQQLTKDLQNAQSFRSSYETLLKELTEKCSKKEEEVSQLKVQLNQYNLQMQNLQRLMCDSQSPDVGTTGAGTALSPNIELQREISTALSSQLRVVKKRLHATRHDYKKLQADYEDLNRKYNLLQKSEKEYPKERKPHCLPCSSKSSKSAVHLKYSEGSKREEPSFKIRSHTKSWDKFTEKVDTEDMDIKWKKRLKSVKRDDDDDLSSSSN